MPSIEHRDVLARPWRTIVDIGANRGQFTLAARAWSSAKVFAFEPLPKAVAAFRAAVGDDESVTLYPCAIGPVAEERFIHIARKDDSSSLLEFGSEQSRIFPGTEEVGRLRISVRPLHSVLTAQDILAPALLKLDVQGFEYEALVGCRELLPRFEQVICECSFVELYKGQKLAADVLALLGEHGFALVGAYNVFYAKGGQCVQADLLFSRRV